MRSTFIFQQTPCESADTSGAYNLKHAPLWPVPVGSILDECSRLVFSILSLHSPLTDLLNHGHCDAARAIASSSDFMSSGGLPKIRDISLSLVSSAQALAPPGSTIMYRKLPPQLCGSHI